jgi:hypothetical protein
MGSMILCISELVRRLLRKYVYVYLTHRGGRFRQQLQVRFLEAKLDTVC